MRKEMKRKSIREEEEEEESTADSNQKPKMLWSDEMVIAFAQEISAMRYNSKAYCRQFRTYTIECWNALNNELKKNPLFVGVELEDLEKKFVELEDTYENKVEHNEEIEDWLKNIFKNKESDKGQVVLPEEMDSC